MMKKSKPVKFITLVGFVILVSGFVAFKAGKLESSFLSDSPQKSIVAMVDTPPASKPDSILIKDIMLMGSSKSMILTDDRKRNSVDSITKAHLDSLIRDYEAKKDSGLSENP